VTGASRGIGAAVSRLAAADGYAVVVNYSASVDIASALVDEIGNDSFAVQADVGDEAALLAMFAEIDERAGRLDVLVNNAGIQHVAPIQDFPIDKWDAVIAVNLSSSFHTIRAALPQMLKRNWGRIINIASAHGLVQAVKGDRKYELIPSRVLRGDVPVAFAEEFVHWYDINDDCLEFRPIKDPWTSSPDNWRLTRARAGSKWHLIKDGISLVGVKSETAKMLSGILSPLEDPLQIHTIFHHSSSSLGISLPRLQLGFHLKSGASSIQSKQFRGMSIDTDQSLGTLVGLRNKLMLKHENDGNRLVVLPEGERERQ
jgi:hypothetical protein